MAELLFILHSPISRLDVFFHHSCLHLNRILYFISYSQVEVIPSCAQEKNVSLIQ
jgi:hypothetical protein